MSTLSKEEKHAMWAALSPSQRLAKKREEAQRAVEHPGFNRATVERAQSRMDRVDAFPADIRAVIYEHGLEIVQEFWNHGVRKAKSILHLIATVRGDDLPNGQSRFALNRKPSAKQNSLNIDLVTIPREPTKEMIAASIAEVSNFNEHITKQEKHRRRLRVAILVAAGLKK